MKKIFYSLFVVFILAGCKKEKTSTNTATPSSTANVVTFSISDFGLTSGSLSTNGINATTALKDQIKYLQYAKGKYPEPGFYNDFESFKTKQFAATDPNFGLIKDSVPDGHSNFSFVGSDVPGEISVKTIPLSGGNRYYRPTFSLDYKLLTSNMYAANIDTTLTGMPINKPVIMHRMVSKVTIHLNDAIPANAAKFILTFVDYPTSLDLVSIRGLDRGRRDDFYPDASFEFPITANYIGKKGVELCSIVFPYSYPEISLQCLDAKGNIIAKKVLPKNFENVYNDIAPNTQYKFTGNFFAQSANFNITVDTKWNSPVNIPFALPGSTQRL
ncbi:hypothetical protein FPZ43_17480 [Mucilaginibacter pallidiroseus]|uniref:Uncharacterized protein n=1 Tax=Mucilaginibacter pallidiroseus TaxID=2599295 RepID=A0A563U278_9SPHI|nr:hypothetical protein [Mucilaginibacter pallidiroseus]TWR25261.1 hypothetical protein FPZ43_17480 [Mucilaginibacter pallidiroseus]